MNFPYTRLVIEDVMFLNYTRLVSIEYIFYQIDDNVKYVKLHECKTNLLNTNNFRKKNDSKIVSDTSSVEKNLHFKRKPICYSHSTGDYLENTSNNRNRLLSTPNGDAKVETLLCLWKITYNGQLEKLKEVNITYDSVFMPSIRGQMKLRLSNDKHLVFLPVIKSYGPNCKQI